MVEETFLLRISLSGRQTRVNVGSGRVMIDIAGVVRPRQTVDVSYFRCR